MSKTTKKKAPTGTKAKATKATSGDTDMKNLLGLMQGMMQKTEPSHAHAHAAPASRTHIKEHGINSLSELRDDMTMLSSSLTGRITQVEAKVGSLSDSMDEIKEMMKVRNAKFDQELQNCTKHTAELVEEERAKRLKLLKALQKKLSDDDVVIMERVSKMKDEVTKVTAGLSADIQGTFTELTKLKGNVESSSQQRTQWQQQSSSTAEKLNSKLKILEVKLNASNNGLFVAADDGCLNDNGSDFPDDASDDFISNMHIDSSSHQQQFMRTRYRSQSGSSQGPAFSQRPKVPVERVLQELRQQMGKLESNVESTSTIANDAYVACTGKSHRMMNAVLSASSNSNSNSHGHSHSQSLHRKHGGSSRSSRRADSGSDSESDDDVNNHAKLSLRSQQAEVKALAKRVKTLGENTSKACRTLSSGLTDVQQSTLFLYAWCDKAHDAFSVVSSQLGLTTNICPRVQLIEGKIVLELGSGTGLVSIVSLMLGAQHVISTERCVNEFPMGYFLLRYNYKLNLCHPDQYTVREEIWGGLGGVCSVPPAVEHVDVLLGSDVLYSSEAFYPLLSTVSRYMQRNPRLTFYMTYQERSSHRVLTPHLEAFKMRAENIPLSQFVHESQLVDAIIQLQREVVAPTPTAAPVQVGDDRSASGAAAAATEAVLLPLDPLTSIYCIKITKALND